MNLYLLALLGATFQELLYWYGLRAKLSSKKYELIIKSKHYWAITVLFVTLSPLIVTIFMIDRNISSLSVAIALGGSSPLLFKHFIKGVRIFLGEGELGGESSQDFRGAMNDYF